MTHSRTAFTPIVVLLTLLCLGTAAAAPTLTFTYKDINAPGASETDTYAINNNGVIAGDYVDANNVQHAMFLKGKTLTTVDRSDCQTTPGGTGIQFFGINNNNAAVGWCTNNSNVQIAFKYSKKTGKMTDINIPGAQLVNANGINDDGHIVGTYVDSSGLQHGFLLIGTKLKNLDPPGVVSLATAFGININEVITVYGLDANGKYISFKTKDKGLTYKPFHAPGEGSIGTAIHHINNFGDIVATYFDANNNRHGVLFHNRKFFPYDDPNGVNSTRGVGINDTLGIVGRYSPASGNPPNQGYFAQAK